MEKDNSVRLGETPCDFCSKPSVATAGIIVVCDDHRDRLDPTTKSASDDCPLKAAPIHLADKHKQK